MICPATRTSWPRGGCACRWPESPMEKMCWCQTSDPRKSSSRWGWEEEAHIYITAITVRLSAKPPVPLPQALVCSCFIPIYCGLIPPAFRGVVCVSLSHQQVCKWRSVTHKHPLCVSHDLCWQWSIGLSPNTSSQLFNHLRCQSYFLMGIWFYFDGLSLQDGLWLRVLRFFCAIPSASFTLSSLFCHRN